MKQTHKVRSRLGFSIVEVIIIIGIVGILAGLAVPMVSRVTEGSKEAIGSNVVATLNNATREFGHAQYTLFSDPTDDTADDEVQILQTLQWIDTDIEIGVAGPFMKTDWVPSTSANTEDYRITWAGSFWKLVLPGEDGAGLKVDFDAKDTGKNVTLGDDFTPFPPYSEAIPELSP